MFEDQPCGGSARLQEGRTLVAVTYSNSLKEADPKDPQKLGLYRAQTKLAQLHPADDLSDLAAAQEYASDVTAAEGVNLTGCFRAWQHDGGDDLLIDRSGLDQNLVGEGTMHPTSGLPIVILPWQERCSHFDPDFNEMPDGNGHRSLGVTLVARCQGRSDGFLSCHLSTCGLVMGFTRALTHDLNGVVFEDRRVVTHTGNLEPTQADVEREPDDRHIATIIEGATLTRV